VGGTARVFLVRTPWKDRPIGALKRLEVHEPSVLERFRHEAALAIRLRHPNLTETFDAGIISGEVFVCSELVLGKSLEEIAVALGQRKELPAAGIGISVLRDVLAALDYISLATDIDGSPLGLTHRDVSPSNIIVGYDGVSRLIDFGIAKSSLNESLKLTAPGLLVGTICSMAPEVIRGERASQASDVYGLGASLFRFFGGVPPFPGASINEILVNVATVPPHSLAQLRPDLPEWLVRLVHRMLEKETKRRPTAGTLLGEVEETAPIVRPADAAAWMDTLFRGERERAVTEIEELVVSEPSMSEFAASTTSTAIRVTTAEILDVEDTTVRSNLMTTTEVDRPPLEGVIAAPFEVASGGTRTEPAPTFFEETTLGGPQATSDPNAEPWVEPSVEPGFDLVEPSVQLRADPASTKAPVPLAAVLPLDPPPSPEAPASPPPEVPPPPEAPPPPEPALGDIRPPSRRRSPIWVALVIAIAVAAGLSLGGLLRLALR
jgi:eukaryotic-like serine/threonine-protein kinase